MKTIEVKSKKTPFIRITTTAVGVAVLGGMNCSASSDYGPATWRPNCGQYYTSGNGHRFHVTHDMEGYYASVISYFQNCSTSASAHYLVNGKQDTSTDYAAGDLTQMVLEANYAWHALCWNTYATGTEHEGFANNPAWYTEAMYQASAGATKHICEKFGYAKDRNHVVGHNEWQNAAWRTWASANLGINPSCNTHTDPGPYWNWSHYMDLINSGGAVNGHINPCVAKNSDGRQELFAVGKDGQLYHMYQTTANAGWSGWVSMGGSWAQNVSPAVARNSNGTLEIFVIGTTGQMYHSYQQTAGSSSSWTGWASLGGSFAQYATVACGVNADGRLEVFAVGTGSDLQHAYQQTTSGWSAFSSLGGSWSQTACVRTGNNLDGRQEVFVIGGTGEMYHNYQTSPNAGWVGWSSLGGSWGQSSRFAVARNSDGRLELFAIAGGGDLQHAYQTAANGAWWGWASLGGSWNQASQPVAAINADGRVVVAVIGSTGNFYEQYQLANGWSGWVNLGGTFSYDIRPCIGSNLDGRLELFTTGQAGDMVHAYQNSAVSTSSWTGWPSLGGSWN